MNYEFYKTISLNGGKFLYIFNYFLMLNPILNLVMIIIYISAK
jgi:hypothetical protein